jgi:hypothetical protein
MLSVKLNEEAVISLWDSARVESQNLASLRRRSHRELKRLRGMFFSLLAHRPFHVVECVALPAPGATHGLGLRLKNDFHRTFATGALKELPNVHSAALH